MSSFIVSELTINDVVELAIKQRFVPAKYERGMGKTMDFDQLGQDLCAMNVSAYTARYKDADIQPLFYVHKKSDANIYQMLKSAKCLHYQCLEGDVALSNLFSWLENLIYRTMSTIIDKMPEYESAQWDRYSTPVPAPVTVTDIKKEIERKSLEIQAARKNKTQLKTSAVAPKIPKKPRRDWLKRRIMEGKIEAKCDYHYTDDYAFDAAFNFQKTDWRPAKMEDDQPSEGHIVFTDWEFGTHGGRCYLNEDGNTISFRIHSNLHYTMRFKGGAQ